MNLNQKGFSPLVLLAAVTILLFLIITSTAPFRNKMMAVLFPKTSSEAAAPPQSGNKITWQGRQWNISGVNMPWFNWGFDFGCNSGGGVVGTRNQISPRFQQLKDAKLHMVRWWVFPGDNPWQITVDGGGMPVGINNAVYADFDAALQLADQYDLYYNFVLFNSATAPRRSWIDNPTHRVALANVLGTLFARYKDNPRVMTWEIYNEPEFQIWDGSVSEANVVATARAISDSVHANSDALVTVGHAFPDGMPMWASANLDYYSPHWYDYMSGGGDWCLQCHNYDYYKNKYGITKPIVAGEIYLASEINPVNRLNEFYDKGYAGVWGWSLFHDHTNDRLQVDLTAAAQFVNSKTDIGPSGSVVPSPTSAPSIPPSPSVSPASTPSPSPTPSASAKPGDIDGNNKVDIFDYNILLTNFGRTGVGVPGDLDKNNKVDIFDYNIVLTNFGK